MWLVCCTLGGSRAHPDFEISNSFSDLCKFGPASPGVTGADSGQPPDHLHNSIGGLPSGPGVHNSPSRSVGGLSLEMGPPITPALRGRSVSRVEPNSITTLEIRSHVPLWEWLAFVMVTADNSRRIDWRTERCEWAPARTRPSSRPLSLR